METPAPVKDPHEQLVDHAETQLLLAEHATSPEDQRVLDEWAEERIKLAKNVADTAMTELTEVNHDVAADHRDISGGTAATK